MPSNPTRQKEEEEEEEEEEEKETRVSLPFSFCKAKIGKKMMTRITRDHQREFVSKKKKFLKTRVPSHSFIASLISSESQYPLAPPPPAVNSSCDDPSDRIEKKVSERGVVVISDFQFSLKRATHEKKKNDDDASSKTYRFFQFRFRRFRANDDL